MGKDSKIEWCHDTGNIEFMIQIQTNMNILPAKQPIYRINELNSAYDSIFEEGKGWIYVTNESHDYRHPLLACVWLNEQKSAKHTIDIIS